MAGLAAQSGRLAITSTKFLEPVFAREAIVLQEEGKSAQLAAGEKEVEHTDKWEYILMALSLGAAGLGFGMARDSIQEGWQRLRRAHRRQSSAPLPPAL
jgi:hypothetical protein